VRFANVYGIDMPTRHELIASDRSDEEICREIGADGLIYQDLDALKDGGAFAQPIHHGVRDLLLRWLLCHRRRQRRVPQQRREPAQRRQAPAEDADAAQLDLNLVVAD
jgi:hypothetical protein